MKTRVVLVDKGLMRERPDYDAPAAATQVR